MEGQIALTKRRRRSGGNYVTRPLVTPIGRVYELHETYMDAQSCRRQAERMLDMAEGMPAGSAGQRFLIRRARQLLTEAGVHERAVQRWFMRELDGDDEPDLVA